MKTAEIKPLAKGSGCLCQNQEAQLYYALYYNHLCHVTINCMVYILAAVINEMDGGMKSKGESSVQYNSYSSCVILSSNGINWRS